MKAGHVLMTKIGRAGERAYSWDMVAAVPDLDLSLVMRIIGAYGSTPRIFLVIKTVTAR